MFMKEKRQTLARFPANFLQMLWGLRVMMKLYIRQFELNSLEVIKLLKMVCVYHRMNFLIQPTGTSMSF